MIKRLRRKLTDRVVDRALVFAFPQSALAVQYQELLASLWLYSRRYDWTQLTTEQKELWADAIDLVHSRQPDAEEFSPVDRWWR